MRFENTPVPAPVEAQTLAPAPALAAPAPNFAPSPCSAGLQCLGKNPLDDFFLTCVPLLPDSATTTDDNFNCTSNCASVFDNVRCRACS